MGIAALPIVAAIAVPLLAKAFGPKAPKPPKFSATQAPEAKKPVFANATTRAESVATRRRTQSIRGSTLLGGSQTGLLEDPSTTTSLLS